MSHAWHGAPDLSALLVDITTLKPDSRNARKHPERNLAAIKASLERFGQMKPIVALADGTVVAGNGLLVCAREIGWTHLAVVTAAGFSEAEAIAFGLADNRTAELALWEHDTLRELGAELAAVDRDLFIGFTDVEMDALMRGWKVGEQGMTLAGTGTPVEPSWDGMPEYEQDDLGAFRSIIVHFRNQDDVAEFSEKMGVPIATEKTKSVWFPPYEKRTAMDKIWVSDASEEEGGAT